MILFKRYNKSFKRDICCFDFRSNCLVSIFFSDKYRKGNVPVVFPYICNYCLRHGPRYSNCFDMEVQPLVTHNAA